MAVAEEHHHARLGSAELRVQRPRVRAGPVRRRAGQMLKTGLARPERQVRSGQGHACQRPLSQRGPRGWRLRQSVRHHLL